MNPPVTSMLEARSVAVVGASARPGSFGETMMTQLLPDGGFDGAVYPVNPRYREVMGLPCLPSLEDLARPVDVAILGVSNGRLEEQLRAAAGVGARSAVIFASCYEPPRDTAPPLTERLTAIAEGARMALCGGNGMGFLNIERGLRACGFSEPADLPPGGITFITHSGSVFSALLHNDRGLRFNLAVSSGLEMVTTTDEYVEYALGLQSTKAVALFIETVRRPEAFRVALRRAAERDIPVVALKVGRAERAREMVTAHSGALAGQDGAYQALFDAHGVLRVDTLDELCDTLELLVAGRRAGPGGLAAIHDSGGERAHLIDVAEREAVPFARISEATRDRLAVVLEEGLPPVNPLDAWGTGNDADRIFTECMEALLADPDTAALAFCVDLTTEVAREGGYPHVAAEIFARTGKPVALLSNLSSAIDRRDAAALRSAGMPVLEGTATGVAAFRHLFAYRDFAVRPPIPPSAPSPPGVRDRWVARLGETTPWSEADGLALLADYGIPVVRTEIASTAAEAEAAAGRIGWPVALKTARTGVAHKTDVDGVRLALDDPVRLADAYAELARRLGPRVLVAAMAPSGVEMALGVVRDDQFGPMVMVAAGGSLVEVLRDRRFALPPLDPTRARAMVEALAARAALEGIRPASPPDVGSLVSALVRLSVLAAELGDHLEALDANPVIVAASGCVAVDALVVPRIGVTP